MGGRGPQAGHGAACGNGGGYVGKQTAKVFSIQCGLKRLMPDWFAVIIGAAVVGSLLAAIGFTIVRLLKRTDG